MHATSFDLWCHMVEVLCKPFSSTNANATKLKTRPWRSSCAAKITRILICDNDHLYFIYSNFWPIYPSTFKLHILGTLWYRLYPCPHHTNIVQCFYINHSRSHIQCHQYTHTIILACMPSRVHVTIQVRYSSMSSIQSYRYYFPPIDVNMAYIPTNNNG